MQLIHSLTTAATAKLTTVAQAATIEAGHSFTFITASTLACSLLSVAAVHGSVTILASAVSNYATQKVLDSFYFSSNQEETIKALICTVTIATANIAAHFLVLGAAGLSITTAPVSLAGPIYLTACATVLVAALVFAIGRNVLNDYQIQKNPSKKIEAICNKFKKDKIVLSRQIKTMKSQRKKLKKSPETNRERIKTLTLQINSFISEHNKRCQELREMLQKAKFIETH